MGFWDIYLDLEYKSITNNYFDAWDFKSTTNCIRKYYKTSEDLFKNLLYYIQSVN